MRDPASITDEQWDQLKRVRIIRVSPDAVRGLFEQMHKGVPLSCRGLPADTRFVDAVVRDDHVLVKVRSATFERVGEVCTIPWITCEVVEMANSHPNFREFL